MPRYTRYRRTYFKKVYPRKRWASNLKSALVDITIPANTLHGASSVVLCENSVQTSVPNPVIVKFGRVKIKGDLRYSSTVVAAISSCLVFVAYVPEGTNLDYNLVSQHPEYILGWTCLSSDSGNSFSLTSSLKRNLNSGDRISILFYVDLLQSSTSSLTFALFMNCQYWTTSA